MTNELRKLSWQCLPKEARVRAKEMYESTNQKYGYRQGKRYVLEMLFGKSNLESDTEPEEMLHCSRDFVISKYKHITSSIAWNEGDVRTFKAETSLLRELFGDKCLPDEEESKPKFKVGDKCSYKGEEAEILQIDINNSYPYLILPKNRFTTWVDESDLEPYTEPEITRKNTQNLSLSDKQNTETKDNMKEKELNLAELLKGCEGGIYFCPTRKEPIFVEHTEDGCKVVPEEEAKKLISTFTVNPDFYSAWMEWKDSRKPKRWAPKDGEKFWYVNTLLNPISRAYDKEEPEDNAFILVGNCFQTYELCQQAAEAVRETLMKFHEQNQK